MLKAFCAATSAILPAESISAISYGLHKRSRRQRMRVRTEMIMLIGPKRAIELYRTQIFYRESKALLCSVFVSLSIAQYGRRKRSNEASKM